MVAENPQEHFNGEYELRGSTLHAFSLEFHLTFSNYGCIPFCIVYKEDFFLEGGGDKEGGLLSFH